MEFLPPRAPGRSCIALLGTSLVLLSGCSGGGRLATPPPSSSPVVIDTQPASATVPLDSTGIFAVQVSGTSPFTYQWYKNGTAISGANSASYSTPPIQSSDNGEQFTVTVSNSVNSLTSKPATLTVGPRSPAPGDLRFQLVGSPWAKVGQWTGGSAATLGAYQSPSYPNAFTNPFSVGDEMCEAGSDGYEYCSWAYDVFDLVSTGSGLSTSLEAGPLADFETALASEISPQSVVRTLDLRPADGEYAMELLTLKGGQFDSIERVVDPSSIAQTVAQDGLQSRVITAVSFDGNGQAHLMSYGMQGDTAVYETQVSIVAPQDVGSAATALADNGFIITAFGGDDADGYVLVGTKVHGDTIPRPIYIFLNGQNSNGAAPGNWAYVINLSWLEYSSGVISSQGDESIAEQ